MKDISHYRKTPIEPQALRSIEPQTLRTPLPMEEPEGYVAFATKDKLARLRIRPAKAATYAAQYLHLSAVAYDADYGTNFVLMFGFITVRVRGQNLQPLITAIEMGTADFVQEFDPARWARPADPAAAIIEWLEIEAGNAAAPEFGSAPPKAGAKPH